ncbi:pyridoxamine 5'-phosphate oxidase family protein [Mycobacterium sp.]|uniref:pyridoxamine 5'-phosphate oxidase family protein n=1 Tax=Mycobacterium sp. TaxID=1785 RepID=UPI003A8BE1BE
MSYREDEKPGVILAASECWELMAGITLGRLVTAVGGRPEIFPVNYAVQRKTILFRTAAGTKLASTAMSSQVLFEVDDHNVAEGWSVIVRGTARSVRGEEQIAEAERAHVLPWTDSAKPTYVRVKPEIVSGRRFHFGQQAQESLRAR